MNSNQRSIGFWPVLAERYRRSASTCKAHQMSENDDVLIDNVVQLYKARIGAALDQLSLDDIRSLVAEIEAKIAACNCQDGS